MALNVGDRLGHYDVTALIGEGGMGQVYRATDTKLERTPFLDRLARAGSPPGHEFIARARVVGDLTRSLRPSHWQARRIEQADLDKD